VGSERTHLEQAAADERQGMIVKFIRCHVRPGGHDEFIEGQREWSSLQGLEGFWGQAGGWVRGDPEHAWILAAWSNVASYRRFMREDHDAIASRARAVDHCLRIEIALFDSLLDMPGIRRNLAESFAGAGLLRIADCLVRSEQREHFVKAQNQVWRPGMEPSGMLGGTFAVDRARADRFLVATLWPDESTHDRYAREALPRLRSAASVDSDLDSISGGQVLLVQDWTVMP
jgi:heme-degrading monooxygenase HmoA